MLTEITIPITISSGVCTYQRECSRLNRLLNQNTSGVLVRVQAGEELVITSNGYPIARLVPVSADSLYLEKLIREGRVEAATDETPFGMPPAIGDPTTDTAAFIIAERYEEDGR